MAPLRAHRLALVLDPPTVQVRIRLQDLVLVLQTFQARVQLPTLRILLHRRTVHRIVLLRVCILVRILPEYRRLDLAPAPLPGLPLVPVLDLPQAPVPDLPQGQAQDQVPVLHLDLARVLLQGQQVCRHQDQVPDRRQDHLQVRLLAHPRDQLQVLRQDHPPGQLLDRHQGHLQDRHLFRQEDPA